jgi:hypothetical protein
VTSVYDVARDEVRGDLTWKRTIEHGRGQVCVRDSK